MTDTTIQIDASMLEQPEFSSKDFSGVRIIKLTPQTNPFVAGSSNISPSGLFSYTTGSNEYIDLSAAKEFLEAKLTIAGFVRIEDFLHVSKNMGRLSINGNIVSTTNSYSHDAILSRRISSSSSYVVSEGDGKNQYLLESVNAIYPNGGYYNTVAGANFTVNLTAANAPLSGYYDVNDSYRLYTAHLDGLFLRAKSRIIIPPNTNFTIEFNMYSDAVNRCAGGRIPSDDTTNQTAALTFGSYWLEMPSYQAPTTAPSEWIMKFVTPKSFVSTANQSNTLQYDVSPNTILMSMALQGSLIMVAPTAAANLFWIEANKFLVPSADWKTFTPSETSSSNATVTDGTPISVQFRFGSQNIPQGPIITNDYGLREAWHIYQQTKREVMGECGGETFTQWKNAGPIWLVPVIKNSADKTNQANLIYVCKNTAPHTASLIFTAWTEQIVRITYDERSGANIGTETA